MVNTILEANVKEEFWNDLRNYFKKMTDILPNQIMQAFLIQNSMDKNIWRLSTIWKSKEDLMEYRKTTDIPDGIKMFRSVGVEPTLSIFEIIEHAKNHE